MKEFKFHYVQMEQVGRVPNTRSWIVVFKFHYVQMERIIFSVKGDKRNMFKFHYVQMEQVKRISDNRNIYFV